MGVVSGCRGAGSQSRWGAGSCAGTEAGSCSRCGLWDGLSRKPHSHGRHATSPAVQQVTYLGDEQGPRSSANLSHTCWGTRSAVFVFRFCCSAVGASPERRPHAGLGAGGHFPQPMAACLHAPATASLKSHLLHPSPRPRAGCTCDTASSQACSLFWVPGVCLICVYGLRYKPDTWGETDWRERKHTERKAPAQLSGIEVFLMSKYFS